MAGVILYADDHIYSNDRPENSLYNELRRDIPVLGLERLDFVEESTKSIGAFRAVILDWQFGNQETFEDVEEELAIPNPITQGSVLENETFTFLNENDFYSLIYIFSQENIEESANGISLKEKFGDRIRFKTKDDSFTSDNITTIKNQILQEIEDWENENRNLSAPIKWSEAINVAIQKVFKELSDASDIWLKHIYDSADKDGVDPELFVIELMQLLLSENLLQDQNLIETIKQEGSQQINYGLIDPLKVDRSISRLFSILSYSKLSDDAPIMTGDVCQINESTYGIIITPECDIRHIKDNDYSEFELLLFSINNFKQYLFEVKSFNKGVDDYETFKPPRKNGLRSLFNQNDPRLHFLPSLPFAGDFNITSVIDFRTSTRRIKSKALKRMSRPYKINSPFIQQIRQRNLAYIGRVGVPSLPNNVRDHNLR